MPAAITRVAVPGTCPSVCTPTPTETCFYDPACEDPYSPSHRGGLGCNAGGKGQHCRFCGFGLYSDISCPDAAAMVNNVADLIDQLGSETGAPAGVVVGNDVTIVPVEYDGLASAASTYELVPSGVRNVVDDVADMYNAASGVASSVVNACTQAGSAIVHGLFGWL